MPKGKKKKGGYDDYDDFNDVSPGRVALAGPRGASQFHFCLPQLQPI
jgi:hypothetical protein